MKILAVSHEDVGGKNEVDEAKYKDVSPSNSMPTGSGSSQFDSTLFNDLDSFSASNEASTSGPDEDDDDAFQLPRMRRMISSGYGTYFRVGDDGSCLVWGRSDKGQCGIVSQQPVRQRPLALQPPASAGSVCNHGFRRPSGLLSVKLIACAENQVCVVDTSNNLWTYGQLKRSSEPLLDTPVRLSPPGIDTNHFEFESIVAGRGHFLALVRVDPSFTPLKRTNSLKEETIAVHAVNFRRMVSHSSASIPSLAVTNDTATTKTTATNVAHISQPDVCAKCREEQNLRISRLNSAVTAEAELLRRSGGGGGGDADSPRSRFGMVLPFQQQQTCKDATLVLKSDDDDRNDADGTDDKATIEPNQAAVSETADVKFRSNADTNSWAGVGRPRGFDSIVKKPRTQSGSAQFSFVSLDLLADTFVDSDKDTTTTSGCDSDASVDTDSGVGHCSVAKASHSAVALSHDNQTRPCSSTAQPPPPPLDTRPSQVWAWGGNFCGQLGIGDFIDRKEPHVIERLSHLCAVKIVAGDEHSACLTATGELYVWGSNSDGQLKQADRPAVSLPTLFKIGFWSSVLDVSACSSFTCLIFNVYDSSSSAVYHCGRRSDNNIALKNGSRTKTTLPTPTRIAFLEQIGWPCAVSCRPNSLYVSLFPRHPSTDALAADVFAFVFAELRFARLITQLRLLATQLQEKALMASGDPVCLQLLVDLTDAFCSFLRLVCATSNRLRAEVVNSSEKWGQSVAKKGADRCEPGATESGGAFNPHDKVGVEPPVFRNLLFHHCSADYLRALDQLHQRFAGCIAYGAFADFDIGEDLSRTVDKMCLENGTESQKQHRRIRKLFGLAFSRVPEYVHLASKVVVTTEEQQHSAKPKSPPADLMPTWCRMWQAKLKYFTAVDKLAEDTYVFWRDRSAAQMESIRRIKRPSRLVVWYADKSALDCCLKSVTFTKGAAVKSWKTVTVFTDMVAIIDRRDRDTVVMEIALLWVSPKVSHTGDDNDRHLVQLLSPESDLTLEFTSAKAKTDFLFSVSMWDNLKSCDDFASLSSSSSSSSSPTSSGSGGRASNRRHAVYKYSDKHADYPSCKYEGHWMDAKPHGSGTMTYADGKTFKGRFRNGIFHGHGTMRFGEGTDRRLACEGFWKDGKMSGLAVIQYSDGGCYEGYAHDEQRSGHGVWCAGSVAAPSTGGGKESRGRYVGGWKHDKRNGYGVHATQTHQYMGMWLDDERHGLGCVITIDGTSHRGLFEREKLAKGTLFCADSTVYEGDFNGCGVLNGKGVLTTVGGDKFDGYFYGNILTESVKISSASLSRGDRGAIATPVIDCNVLNSRPEEYPAWSLSADQKWTEMFDQFYADILKVNPYLLNESDTQRVWEAMAAAVSKVKMAQGTLGLTFDDELETVPEYAGVWSAQYYAMVQRFWTKALCNKFHPLCRLFTGVVEVFVSSYSGIAAHKTLLNAAVAEYRSLVRRIYGAVRQLFPSLPPEGAMHSFVPLSTVSQNEREGAEDDDVNVGSNDHGDDEDDENIDRTVACDFVSAEFLRRCYAELMTLYALACQDTDTRYWDRTNLLNARNDVALLDFLGVERDLWPFELRSDMPPLQIPLLCATARSKYYGSAIDTLQRLSGEVTPVDKLKVLAETFAEVTKCVKLYATAGDSNVWNLDKLFPVFLFVVVRAQLQRLGAEILCIHDLIPDDRMDSLGAVGHMFCTLQASYQHIIREKGLP